MRPSRRKNRSNRIILDFGRNSCYDPTVPVKALEQVQQYLENVKASHHDKMPCDEERNMAKYKDRVQVGDEIKWVAANSKRELHLAIAQALYDGGELEEYIENVRSENVPTVREFVEQVYQKTYIDTLAPKTIDNYKQYLNLNILPFMGDMKLDEVNVSTIQQFYNWMATASQRGRKKDLNERSIERIGGLASRIFKVALEMKLIKDTPFKTTLLTIRSEEAGRHKPMTDAEIHRIKHRIPKLSDTTERLYMALLAYTGMRLEEVLGLRWDDVHLDSRYCVVTNTVTYPGNNTPTIRNRTKSKHSCRTVILPEPLLKILKEAPSKKGFLIGGEQPLCYSSYQRMRRRAFAHLEIKGYSNHDFRTTFATQLCEKGITSKEVADLMGHADTRMVETVYARRRHEGVMKHSDLINEMNSAYHSNDVS